MEIGYGVEPAGQSRDGGRPRPAGLGPAAGRAKCVASTRRTTCASQAVLARLGFVPAGEAIDERDGLELVFTLELEPFARPAGAPVGSTAVADRPPGGVA